MSHGDETLCKSLEGFLEKKKYKYDIKEQQHSTHYYISCSKLKSDVNIYNSGKFIVGGAESDLKKMLQDVMEKISAGTFRIENELTTDIENFPSEIRRDIPDCDEVIVSFIEEIVKAYEANLLIATTFLLGAASERAISILMAKYAEAIGNEKHKESFQQKMGKKKVISAKFDEFLQSYKSCKTRLKDEQVDFELETVLHSLFNFYRITRNEVGHPIIPININKGILLANLGQFVHYLQLIYKLIHHFQENKMEL